MSAFRTAKCHGTKHLCTCSWNMAPNTKAGLCYTVHCNEMWRFGKKKIIMHNDTRIEMMTLHIVLRVEHSAELSRR